MMALHRITEHSSPAEAAPEPEILLNSGGNSGGSTSYGGGDTGRDQGPEMLKEAVQKVRQLHRHLDLVSNAYNDVYEQFQPLREEYERRLEECRFFELQCHRLDMHCRALEDRLKRCGSEAPRPFDDDQVVQPRPLDENQARRCLSLSSLRDSRFWDERFKSLSALTAGTG